MVWILQVILFFSSGSQQTIDLNHEYETFGECESAKAKVSTLLAQIEAVGEETVRRYTTTCFAWRRDGN